MQARTHACARGERPCPAASPHSGLLLPPPAKVGGNFPWVSPEEVAATLAAGPKQMWVDWVRVWGKPASWK